MKNIIEVTAIRKSPKNPKGFNYLEICRRDFDDFRERASSNVANYLSYLVRQNFDDGKNLDIIMRQIKSLEDVKNLLKQGNEKLAFTNFMNTFPSCLPHRTQRF